MKSIFLNTLQIHSNTSNLGYVVNKIEGLDFPEIRLSNYNRPGEYGGFVSNSLYGGRRITITGQIFSASVVTFQTLRRNFENALGITRDTNSIPQPITLKIQTMDDLQLQASVFLASPPKIIIDEMNIAQFMLDLYAPDYFLATQSLGAQSVGIAGGGGAIYPVIYPVSYAAASGNSVNVVNNGTVESYPTIYLNAGLTNPIIQNLTNGRYLQLALALTGTDQVIIDMRARTIIKNGSQSVISNKSSGSQFWWLEKGTNVIKLLTESGGDTGNGQIQWRDAYLGV